MQRQLFPDEDDFDTHEAWKDALREAIRDNFVSKRTVRRLALWSLLAVALLFADLRGLPALRGSVGPRQPLRLRGRARPLDRKRQHAIRGLRSRYRRPQSAGAVESQGRTGWPSGLPARYLPVVVPKRRMAVRTGDGAATGAPSASEVQAGPQSN